MRTWQAEHEIATRGRGIYAITTAVAEIVARERLNVGQCHVFLAHTSASLLVTENADPDVHRDLESFMQRLVPDGAPWFRHVAEGPDDMAAHLRAMLAGCSLLLPVTAGRLNLGTWQGVYLWEHRSAPHRRRLTITVSGN